MVVPFAEVAPACIIATVVNPRNWIDVICCRAVCFVARFIALFEKSPQGDIVELRRLQPWSPSLKERCYLILSRFNLKN